MITKLTKHEVRDELRELSDNTRKNIMVQLPACKPADFDKTNKDVPFVKVGLSKLLHFIADMM